MTPVFEALIYWSEKVTVGCLTNLNLEQESAFVYDVEYTRKNYVQGIN